jgi:hypothetical protein
MKNDIERRPPRELAELKCYLETGWTSTPYYRVAFKWVPWEPYTDDYDGFDFITVGQGETREEAYRDAGKQLRRMAAEAYGKAEMLEEADHDRK